MRARTTQALVLELIAIGSLAIVAPLSASAAPALPPPYGECAAPVDLAPGVTLSCVRDDPQTSSPSVTHVATVDLDAGGVRPVVALGNDVVFQDPDAVGIPNETVSSMASRASAILGINGGFFDNDKGTSSTPPDQTFSGQICGGFVADGRIVKSPPADPVLGASLAIHDDGHLSIGQVTFSGSITTATSGIPLDGVNALNVAAAQPSCPKALQPGPTDADGVTLLTPDMGQVTLKNDPGVANSMYEIADAVLVTAHAVPAGGYVVDTIEQIPQLQSIPRLPEGSIALLSSDTTEPTGAATWLVDNLPAGTSFEVATALSDPTVTDLIGAPAPLIAGGAPVDLTGYYVPGPGSYNPETMLGLDAAGRAVTIMVVDGYEGYSRGVTVQQAQQLMLAAGVESAVLFDGGGSSTLVADVPASSAGGCDGLTVVTSYDGGDNFPNGCGNQRYVGDGVLFVPVTGPAPAPSPAAAPILPATGSAVITVPAAIAGIALVLTGILLRRRARRG